MNVTRSNISLYLNFDHPPEVTGGAVFTLSISVMVSLILIFNCLVLFLVLHRPNLRKKQTADLVIYLCVSDITVGLSGILFILTKVFHTLGRNSGFCIVTLNLLFAGRAQSLIQTFFICFERFLAVFSHVLFQNFKTNYKNRLRAGAVFFVLIFSTAIFSILFTEEEIEFCGIVEFENYKLLEICEVIICFPFLFLTCIAYIALAISFRRQSRMTHPEIHTAQATETQTAQATESRTAQVMETRTAQAMETRTAQAIETWTAQATETRTARAMETHTAQATETQTAQEMETWMARAMETQMAQATETQTTQIREYQVRERRLTVIVGTIVLALILFTGPNITIKFFDGFGIIHVQPTTRTVYKMLTGINSILNPFLYVLTIPAIRKELKTFFKNCCTCVKHCSTQNTNIVGV